MPEDVSFIYEYILAFTLASSRIYVFFSNSPVLSSQVIPGFLKATIVFSLAFIATPYVKIGMSDHTIDYFLVFIIKEMVIASLLAIFMWTPFYAIEMTGAIHDTLSGQTLSADFNPLTSSESTETSKFFTQVFVCYFFATGMFLYFIQFIYLSFKYIPVYAMGNATIMSFSYFSDTIYNMFKYAVIMLIPFFIVYFMIDFCVTLISKFAEQLSVLSYDTSVKSLAAAMLIGLYLEIIMGFTEELYMKHVQVGTDILRAAGE